MAITIKETKNYDLFEPHPVNRDVVKTKFLEKSFSAHGWIDAYPMHVVKNGNGKYKIKAGHHRFHVARSLGLPVKYVVSEDTVTIQELEQSTNPWSLKDFLMSFARGGNKAYIRVMDYHKFTGIPVNVCVALLSGVTDSFGNCVYNFKRGSFSLGNITHAYVIADLVLHCKKFGISCASQSPFVRALSRIVRLPEFDCEILKHKIETFPGLIVKQPTVATYQKVIEDLYNHQSRKKVPLSFLADEAAKQRNPVGKKSA